MNNRTTFVIVLAAVVLACGVIFLERDVSSVPYQSPDRYNVLRGLQTDNVEKIVLFAGDGSVILRKGGSRWLFERPLKENFAVEWEADAEQVNRLVDQLVNLRQARPAIEGGPGASLDLMKYGLKSAQERIEVLYGSDRGARRVQVLLGSVLSEKGRTLRHIRVNEDDRILVVEDTLGQMMRLAKDGGVEFRSKRAFPRDDLEETTQVVMRSNELRASFEKVTEKVWSATWITERGQRRTVRADAQKVRDIAAAMQELRVERFVEDTFDDSSFTKYGLLKPRAIVQLALEPPQSGGFVSLFSGPSTASLRIGNEVSPGSDEVYAVAMRIPAVFVMKRSFLDSLPKDPEKDLPDKQVATVATGDVKSFTLKGGGETLRVKLEKNDWKVTTPIEIDGDHATVTELLDAVTTTDCTEVKWERDLVAFGLQVPAAELLLRYEVDLDGEKIVRAERIQFGKVFEKEVPKAKQPGADEKKDDEPKTEKKKFVYARRSSDAAVRVLPWEKLRNVTAGPMTFFKRRVLDFSSWNANKFRLERPGGKFEFEKQGNDWLMVTPAKIKADQGNVGGTVSAMGWLNAEKIVSVDASTALAKFGLDKPQFRCEVELKPEEKKEDEKADNAEKKDDKSDAEKKEPEKKEPEVHVLLVAKKTEGVDVTWYGHVPGERLIFTLEKTFGQRLEAELADTDVFPAQWTLKEAVIEFDGGVTRIDQNVDGKKFKVSDQKEGELTDAADDEKGRKFFEDLPAIKVFENYVSYDAKNLAALGLGDKPWARVTAITKEEKKTIVEIGNVADEGQYGQGKRYARRAGQTSVFLLQQADLDKVLKPASAFKKGAAAPPPKKAEEPEKKADNAKKIDEKKPADPKPAPEGSGKPESKPNPEPKPGPDSNAQPKKKAEPKKGEASGEKKPEKAGEKKPGGGP